MRKKCIIIYTEGETEHEFYGLLINEIKKEYIAEKFSADKIIRQCLKGITKFDKKLLKKFEYDVKTKYGEYDIVVFLCYDTDVFDLNAKPPVDWKKVDEKLKTLGAKEVYHIKAEKCIEDILLTDINNICRFLNIPIINRISGKNGVEKMKKLFMKGNRIYQKGFSCGNLIETIDIGLLLNKHNKMFKELIDELLKS